MLYFLKNWTINIVIVAVFIAILETLLPNSSFKGYIKMICGFLIIIVLLNPFINFIYKDISIDKEVFAKFNKYEKKLNLNKEFNDFTNKQITKVYSDKIKNKIKDTLNNEFPNKVIDIEIDVSKQEKNFGEINSMELYISDKKNDEDINENNIKIEDINISKEITKNQSTDREIVNIFEVLKDRYDIPSEIIKVIRR